MKKKEIRSLLEGNEFYFIGIVLVKGWGKMYVFEDKVQIDDDFEEEILMTERRRKRRVFLLWQDCFFLILDFLQFLVIYQFMVFRWIWFKEWLLNIYFVFFFNFDVYEFVKLYSGVYVSVQNYNILSSLVFVQFLVIFIGWFVVILMLVVVYFIIYGVLWYRKSFVLMIKMVYIRRVYVVILQVFIFFLVIYVGYVF